MSGFTRMYWRNILLALFLWAGGTPILAKLAIYDAHFKGVVIRSMRYLKLSVSASGKLGVRPIVHKRWD